MSSANHRRHSGKRQPIKPSFIPAEVRNVSALTEWLPFFSAFFIQLFVGWLEFYVCWSVTTDAYGNDGHYHWLLKPATSHAPSSVPRVVSNRYTITAMQQALTYRCTAYGTQAEMLKVTHFNTPWLVKRTHKLSAVMLTRL